MTNAIFLKSFWHLKVTQRFTCFSVNQVYIFLRQSNIFISSHRWISISSLVGFVVSLVGFVISLVENLLLGVTPEKFWKFDIFPGESSSPYRGTETGCIQLTQENTLQTRDPLTMLCFAIITNSLPILIVKYIGYLRLEERSPWFGRYPVTWNKALNKFYLSLDIRARRPCRCPCWKFWPKFYQNRINERNDNKRKYMWVLKNMNVWFFWLSFATILTFENISKKCIQ